MAIGGSSSIDFNLTESVTKGLASFTLGAGSPLLRSTFTWTDGSGANAVTDLGSATYTIGSAGSFTIDLTADFTDVDGAAIAFATIKVITLFAPSTNAANVTVSFNDTNEWDSAIDGDVILKPNTAAGLMTGNATGYTVTNSTKDVITVTGTANDVLRIAVAGTV